MVPFEVSKIVRHPYKKDTRREPNLENYPLGSMRLGAFGLRSVFPVGSLGPIPFDPEP